MSDQDELRDRIADVIHGVGADHWNDMAQAVIDDLRLEREGMDRSDAKRWVSKWELP